MSGSRWLSLVLFVLHELVQQSRCCTYFELQTACANDEVVIARTMELPDVLNITDWKVNIHPRNSTTSFSNSSSDVNTTKYGFVSLGGMHLPAAMGMPAFGNVELDGMNEKGLSVAAQSQYRAEYPVWDNGVSGSSLVFGLYVVRWLLSSFETVAEVRAAVDSGRFVVSFLGMSRLISMHWAIADVTGNSVVLEFERGKARFYDNSVRVMTNDPSFPWHVEHINAYPWISAVGSETDPVHPLSVSTGDLLPGQDQVPYTTNHGWNTGGLPGDASPQSRFIRAFFLKQISQTNSPPGSDVGRWLALATAILDAVMVPRGTTGPDMDNTITSDYTQWASLRIPQTGMFAFRSYGDSRWQLIDLRAVDFDRRSTLPMPSLVDVVLVNVTASLETSVEPGHLLI